jgi:NitT/TauT family transport system ATP-binding protein
MLVAAASPDQGQIGASCSSHRRFSHGSPLRTTSCSDRGGGGGWARRVLTHDLRARASELLAAVGLGEFEEHYPHQLSGGMRHRAAFARALINDPTILLMDEPFGALDAITRAGMQEFLLDLWQRTRMTVLFVTHDVEEATLLADRVCVMSTGPGRIVEIVSVGLPRPRNYDMTESAEFVALKRRIRQLVEQGSRRK